jgi:hypothetical protein
MAITIAPKIKKEIFELLKEYGYESEKDFVEDALKHRILELKKKKFFVTSEKIKKELLKRGIRPEKLLREFKS